jgi:hypothetical protein
VARCLVVTLSQRCRLLVRLLRPRVHTPPPLPILSPHLFVIHFSLIPFTQLLHHALRPLPPRRHPRPHEGCRRRRQRDVCQVLPPLSLVASTLRRSHACRYHRWVTAETLCSKIIIGPLLETPTAPLSLPPGSMPPPAAPPARWHVTRRVAQGGEGCVVRLECTRTPLPSRAEAAATHQVPPLHISSLLAASPLSLVGVGQYAVLAPPRRRTLLPRHTPLHSTLHPAAICLRCSSLHFCLPLQTTNLASRSQSKVAAGMRHPLGLSNTPQDLSSLS